MSIDIGRKSILMEMQQFIFIYKNQNFLKYI